MDIFQKIFLYLGAMLAACFLVVALIALSNAENGQLTVESLSHLEDQFRSFYELFRWFVYIWMAVAIFLFIRFLTRIFR
ncbi:hypothetical protein [Thiomicrorhabdus sediminis]|uniref:Uncharacterized protein n=1 Tax=Thiomicrorhabdus sediminis TaxID=2580412 RepID=A0A4P9K4I0_9GAMM|nr:hypothetical protein [Thiomicrorhabdus sediminis]QCU89842.1 hypothetical protein FE785_03895 [Thiomicrorhabdus sediminis]